MAGHHSRSLASAKVERSLRSLFKRCVQCPPDSPSCPPCASDEICSFVPESCDECAHMVCIADPNPAPTSSGPNVGAIAGGVVGGVAFIALVVFCVWFFYIKKRRQQQDQELSEEWEEDEVGRQKAADMNHRMDVMQQHDGASTRTRGSLANSFLSRASNVIQIAYIPGVTNRNGSSHNSIVPPVPAARRSQPPKSPLANENDALFFRPGDLRDSSYSATSSLTGGGNRDTRYTMQSLTPSLARSSVASADVVTNDASSHPMPATTMLRAQPRMVSVKSSPAPSSTSPPASSTGTPPTDDANGSYFPKGKGPQVLMPGQGSPGSANSPRGAAGTSGGGQYAKAKQVTVGGGGGAAGAAGRKTPVRQASDASGLSGGRHTPAVSSPLVEADESGGEGEGEGVGGRGRGKEGSPFLDAAEIDGKGKGGGLSAVIEEATKRSALTGGVGEGKSGSGEEKRGERGQSPFGDEHATE